MRLCFGHAPVSGRIGLQPFFRSLSMINVLYRGGPLRRAPRPATRKAKPATPRGEAGDALLICIAC